MDKLDTGHSISEFKEIAVLKVWQCGQEVLCRVKSRLCSSKHETLSAESPAFLITLCIWCGAIVLLNVWEVKIYIPWKVWGYFRSHVSRLPLPPYMAN